MSKYFVALYEPQINIIQPHEIEKKGPKLTSIIEVAQDA